jgi:hypothetical protein
MTAAGNNSLDVRVLIDEELATCLDIDFNDM